ncbi:MAG: DUF2911 domain-containing protein [Verrucomicrobia bacterium]|nr:DUF2911 domain-containing protein [Verrucomicrobiota bacterium]
MNFPTVRVLLVSACALTLVSGLSAQAPAAPKLDIPAASPAASFKQRVGITDIEVVYSRPSMKGREVFGKLEPFGEVWRLGANSATRITFSTGLKVQGAALAAGTYEVFALLGKSEWTVIFQKADKSNWGAYSYKQENDTLRVTAKVAALAQPVETFTIAVNNLRDSSATLDFTWEKTLVSLKLEMDVSSLVPGIEAVMAGDYSKKPYVAAAMFYLDNNFDLKKALEWMNAAIAEQPEAFFLVYRKAKVQAAMGDKAGALATAQASLAGANATKMAPAIRDEYVRLNNALISSLK